jgi:hypothetical protein
MVKDDPQEKLDWLRAAACIQVDICVDWPWGRNDSGYGKIKYRRKDCSPHRLVCEMVHGPCLSGMEAAHSCGRRICASGRHLRWDTPKGNHADRHIHGTALLGEAGGSAKLTNAQVLKIRELAGSTSKRQLAFRYGVSRRTIFLIVNRRTWTHV